LPKKGLLSALSTQSCSLSANVADDCLLTMTGSSQLSSSATIAGVNAGSPSIRETPIASKPLNVIVSLTERFDVRFA
jgi:hypothetical protein